MTAVACAPGLSLSGMGLISLCYATLAISISVLTRPLTRLHRQVHVEIFTSTNDSVIYGEIELLTASVETLTLLDAERRASRISDEQYQQVWQQVYTSLDEAQLTVR